MTSKDAPYSTDLFLNSFFLFGQMPIPNAAGYGHDSVVERGGFVAVNLRDAAQTLDSADGMFDLAPATGMRLIFGTLPITQDGIWVLFTPPGLAVGQRLGIHVVIGDQAQVAQIG